MSLPELEGRPIEVTVWGRTDPGLTRSENQDTFLILRFPADPEDLARAFGPGDFGGGDPGGLRFHLGPRGSLLMVADGMGGAAAGATASREAVSRIHEVFHAEWERERERTPGVFARHLVRAVEESNRHLHRMASGRRELDGMGTTLTAAGLLDEFLYLAQVGDSRGYLIRNGTAVQITRDQSMVQELMETGALTEAQARRSSQRNVILQALGTTPTVDVDLTFQEVRRGDRLLLCSDGLSGVVEASEIAEYAARYPAPPQLCEALIQLANERGGPDNITVAVASFDGPGLRAPAADEAVGRQPFPLPDP